MIIDWHIHSVLSPCASLDMSPVNIFAQAQKKRIGLIGICDHNSTRQARLMAEMESEVAVLPGVELTSKEEVHCLAFFDDLKALDEIQKLIDCYLPFVRNKPEVFGDQVVVDERGKILYIEEALLHLALKISLDQLIKEVRQMNGLIIPAHANKPVNSILSQIGFVPSGLDADAMEVIYGGDPRLDAYPWVRSSDAHTPEHIGQQFTELALSGFSILELKQAINALDNG